MKLRPSARIGVKCCEPCVAPERHSGCHATCQKYKDERKRFELDKEAVRENIKQTPNITKSSFNDLVFVDCKNLKPRQKR